MAERISKTQRWLDLIAFLVGRKVPVEVEQIMEAVPSYASKYVGGDEKARETVRRMFERDKDELRDLGIPIETTEFSVNYGTEVVLGYRLKSRDFYLPYLRLLSKVAGDAPQPSALDKARYGSIDVTPEEVGPAYDALTYVAHMPGFPFREEARSAMRKFSFDIPLMRKRSSPVLFIERPEADEVRQKVRVLSDALLARKRVKFTYHGLHRGEATERNVAPYGMLFQQAQWYLVGHDELRDDVRVFRVGRLSDPRVNARAPKTPDYEVPGGFTLDSYRGREAWELGSEDDPVIEARVRFEFPTCLWADRNGFGSLMESREDGSQVRAFAVRQVDPFLRWILSLEGNARIEAPTELLTALQELARDVIAIYEEHPDAGVGDA
jgi:proteasome accessory factor B